MSEFNLKQQTTPIAISQLHPGLFGLPCRDVMWRILTPGHSARIAERRPSAFRAIHQCGAVCNVHLVVSLESCEARGVVEVVTDIPGRAASMTLAIAILVPSSSDPALVSTLILMRVPAKSFIVFLGIQNCHPHGGQG